LKPELMRLKERMAVRFPNNQVGLDETWYDAGRLCVLFNEDTPPETVAGAMLALIEETFPDLDLAVRNTRFAYGGTSSEQLSQPAVTDK